MAGDPRRFKITVPVPPGRISGQNPQVTQRKTAALTRVLEAGKEPSSKPTRKITVSDSPYQITATDGYVQVSATLGVVQVLLPSVPVDTGRRLTIQKRDATANAVQVTDIVQGFIGRAGTAVGPSLYLHDQFASITLQGVIAVGDISWLVIADMGTVNDVP